MLGSNNFIRLFLLSNDYHIKLDHPDQYARGMCLTDSSLKYSESTPARFVAMAKNSCANLRSSRCFTEIKN